MEIFSMRKQRRGLEFLCSLRSSMSQLPCGKKKRNKKELFFSLESFVEAIESSSRPVQIPYEIVSLFISKSPWKLFSFVLLRIFLSLVWPKKIVLFFRMLKMRRSLVESKSTWCHCFIALKLNFFYEIMKQ